MQRCTACNRELETDPAAYDARRPTCADWGARCRRSTTPDADAPQAKERK